MLAILLLLNLLLSPPNSMTVQSVAFWICLNIILEIALNALIATIVSKAIKKEHFSKPSFLYNVSKKERNFYDKIKIKNWKDKVLELGALNGFRKNKIADSNDPQYIERFILEDKIGLVIHFYSIVFGTILAFAMPYQLYLRASLLIVFTNFGMSFPSFCILRYNLPRLETALKFAKRAESQKAKEESSTPSI